MLTTTENAIGQRLWKLELNQDELAQRHGDAVARMARHASGLLRLLSRLAFDLSLSAETRHVAAAGALYLAEPDDYYPDSRLGGMERMLDDVLVGFLTLQRVIAMEGRSVAAAHWKGPGRFSDVLALMGSVPDLEAQVPTKVLEKARAFVGAI